MSASPEIGRTITAAGIETNVHVLGDPASRPAVLLVHGSGPGVTAFSNWRLTMPELARDYCVVAPDIVGFGYTERPADFAYEMPAWTTHLLGVMDALAIERAHVIGNSFGGSLAMSLAIHHPQRLDRLVLMGSVGVPMRISEGLDRVWGYQPSVQAMRDMLDLFAYDQSLVGDDLARIRYEASIRPGVQESFAAMFPAPRQRSLDAMSHDIADIAGIQHPTLVVHGRDDRVIPLASSYALLDLIPRSELHVFGQCGHWTQIEHGAAFSELVRDFLGRSNT